MIGTPLNTYLILTEKVDREHYCLGYFAFAKFIMQMHRVPARYHELPCRALTEYPWKKGFFQVKIQPMK